MLEIVTYPNKILETQAKSVDFPLNKEDSQIIQNMWDYVVDNDEAAGLAAPQIGESKKICIVSDEKGNPALLINPKITFFSKLETSLIEGCLSFSGEFYEIDRPKNIKLEYYDKEGKKRVVDVKGWLSRVIQHEVDHLNGVLFINKGGRKVSEEEIKQRSKEVVD